MAAVAPLNTPHHEARTTVLEVRGLSVAFPVRGQEPVIAVRSLSFQLARGATLAVIGESGSGKTTGCRALMGLLPATAQVQGAIRIEGREYMGQTAAEWQKVRGRVVSMVFQDPSRSLNPTMRVGAQIIETIRLHRPVNRSAAAREALELMDLLQIDAAASRFRSYPHELSGGMRQRVAIAVAVAARPRLLIADECTRALDPVTEAGTLQLLRDTQKELGMAMIMIGHNIHTLAGMADEILVMHAGDTVEHASADQVLRSPRMPYTRALLQAKPDGPIPRTGGGQFASSRARQTSSQNCGGADPVLVLRNVSHSYGSTGGFAGAAGPALPALHEVSLEIGEREMLGVVGQNGSGKSTLARAILQLPRPTAGSVIFEGIDLTKLGLKELRRHRQRMQLVLQDATGSLNPRWRVTELVSEPLVGFGIGDKAFRQRRIREVLDRVGLPLDVYGRRRPGDLSGGQCQRVAIARALTVDPKLLILDEAVSTLDALTQIQIIELLMQLRQELGLSVIFISHDMQMVQGICDRVASLHQGRVREIAPARAGIS